MSTSVFRQVLQTSRPTKLAMSRASACAAIRWVSAAFTPEWPCFHSAAAAYTGTGSGCGSGLKQTVDSRHSVGGISSDQGGPMRSIETDTIADIHKGDRGFWDDLPEERGPWRCCGAPVRCAIGCPRKTA